MNGSTVHRGVTDGTASVGHNYANRVRGSRLNRLEPDPGKSYCLSHVLDGTCHGVVRIGKRTEPIHSSEGDAARGNTDNSPYVFEPRSVRGDAPCTDCDLTIQPAGTVDLQVALDLDRKSVV